MTASNERFDPMIDQNAVEAVKGAADGPVFAIVEFTPEAFETAYVSGGTRALYEDEAAMYDYFSRLHEYVNLDLAEIELFTESFFPMANDVRYITTALDIGKMIRVYVDDDRGVFVGLPSETAVEPVVAAIADAAER